MLFTFSPFPKPSPASQSQPEANFLLSPLQLVMPKTHLVPLDLVLALLVSSSETLQTRGCSIPSAPPGQSESTEQGAET
jgi:hypothetical protein